MAGRQDTPIAPPRAVRRLVAALEPPARGAIPRAARGTLVVPAGLGLGAVLFTAAELHLDGAAGIAVRALVAVALAGSLALAVQRLRARIDVMEAFRRGQDAMGEALLLIDATTMCIVYGSPAAAVLYGRSLEELVGLPARELALPADQATIDARGHLREAGHRVPERAAMQIAHPGSDPRFAEWATIPLTVDGHRLLLSLARDVTSRQRAERRLAEEHAFLEAVLEAAAGPISVLAPDGRLLRVNAATARLAGMEPGAMAGRTPWELGLMTAEQGAEVATALRERRDPFRHAVSWRDRAGRERSVICSATAMRDGAGRITSAVSVGVDLTGQRAAEERARRAHAALDLRSHELERSNRDLAEFADRAAHELRESVHAVSGFTDLLDAHDGAVLDARGRSYLAAVREAAGDMDELLDGVAAYGSLGSGEALACDVDCERTLDAVLTELAEEIDARAAAVTRDPLPTVPGDPGELTALLSNLVGNALRFGGATSPRVHVAAQRRDLGWQLTVSDDGGGVPPAERQRIFQLFRRLHPRGAHRGAGVGLALCQRIVERHGGAIWVDDATGGGSAFHVTLPDREAR